MSKKKMPNLPIGIIRITRVPTCLYMCVCVCRFWMNFCFVYDGIQAMFILNCLMALILTHFFSSEIQVDFCCCTSNLVYETHHLWNV